jgi:putative transcriptional regulator
MVFDRAPGSELYAAYASGGLDPALQLLVETQAALQPRLAARLAVADTVAGLMLETEVPAPLRKGALDAVMAQIDVDEGCNRAAPAAARHQQAMKAAKSALDELIALPEPLRDHVFRAVEAGGWRFAGPGIRVMPIQVGGRAKVELMRMEPGAAAPQHSHKGHEYTLVLSGGFSDGTASYGPGALSVAGPDHTHRPVADADGVCIALAVCEAPLAFRGLLGVIQRLVGNA